MVNTVASVSGMLAGVVASLHWCIKNSKVNPFLEWKTPSPKHSI